MRNLFLLCSFIVVGTLSLNVSAQTHDSSEIAKLRSFLLQESAEEGVRNYQQIGLDQMDDVEWLKVPGLTWNKQSYLLERISWPGKNLSGHLDLSGFEALKYLFCSFNNIKSVNVKDSPSLLKFDLYENDLEAMDVTTNPKVDYIRVGYNNIKEIDVSNNPNLSFFCCTKNQVETLDFSNKEKLKTVYCVENNLTSLKIDNCISLDELLCGSNVLKVIDLYNLPSLVSFSCILNGLTELNLYNCTSLNEVLCNNNNLSLLDLAQCKNLTTLNCSQNVLTSLKIEDCDKLTSLYCDNNLLDSLILSESASLSTLSCGNNNLTFLTLPPVTETLTSYSYAPQNYVALECKYDSVDLRDFYLVDDNITKYTWYYRNTTISPIEEDEGLFAFDEAYIGETFICRAQSDTYSKLVMHYDITFTQDGDVSNKNPEKESASIYASGGFIHVMTTSSVDVRVYSMQGALILTKRIGEGRTDISVARGVYMVVVDNCDGQKVFVR